MAGGSEPWGDGAFQLFSLSLFIGRRRSERDACPRSRRPSARLRPRRSRGLVSVGRECVCKAAEKGEGPEVRERL